MNGLTGNFDSGTALAKSIVDAVRHAPSEQLAAHLEACFSAACNGDPVAMAVAGQMLLPTLNKTSFKTMLQRHRLVASKVSRKELQPELEVAAFRLLLEAAGRLETARH